MAQLYSQYASGLQFTAGPTVGSTLGTSGVNAVVDRLNSITSDDGAYSNLAVGEGLDINNGSVISAELATSTNRGVASFNTADFSLTNGSVALNNSTIFRTITAGNAISVTGSTIAVVEADVNPTSLGTSCVALDHGTGTTDMVINVCYGSGATPPTASDTTEGTVYFQYTP